MKRSFAYPLVALTVAGAFVGGCATVQPYVPTPTSTTRQVDRNYVIGREQSAAVGESIVRVKDYQLKQMPTNIVKADKAFTLYAPPISTIAFPTGGSATIVGTTPRDGVNYRMVRLPQSPLLNFLVRDDGTFEGSAVNFRGERMGWSYTPNPPDVRLLPDSAGAVETTPGYENYELVYSGSAGDTLQVLYREYTPNDLARPAFSQQLVFSKAPKRFRYRELQIDFREADNERIVYTVISDGISSGQPK